MKTSELLRRRLASSLLSGQQPETATAVVGHLGAVQAQDYGQSLWAVGCRTRRPRQSAVEAEIAVGSLCRTWPMRGTLHLVQPQDVRWMLGLSAARARRAAARRHRLLGISPADALRAEDLAAAALADGPQSRTALLDALRTGGVSPDGLRGLHLLRHLAQVGLLVVGARISKQPGFVLLQTPPPPGDREQWLAEIARRYVRGHGPATARDLAWWTGLTLTDARGALSSLGDEVVWDGDRAYVDLDPPPMPRDPLLLAGFDEHLLGYAERAEILGDTPFEAVLPGRNGVFLPIVVHRGQVVGTWRRTAVPVTAPRAARRFAAFHDRPVQRSVAARG